MSGTMDGAFEKPALPEEFVAVLNEARDAKTELYKQFTAMGMEMTNVGQAATDPIAKFRDVVPNFHAKLMMRADLSEADLKLARQQQVDKGDLDTFPQDLFEGCAKALKTRYADYAGTPEALKTLEHYRTSLVEAFKIYLDYATEHPLTTIESLHDHARLAMVPEKQNTRGSK